MSKNCIRICVLLIMMTYSVRSQDVMYVVGKDYTTGSQTQQIRSYSIGPIDANSGFDTVYEVQESDTILQPVVYDSAENTCYWMVVGGDISRIEKYDLEDESLAVVVPITNTYDCLVIDPMERTMYCGAVHGIDVFGIDDETIVISTYMSNVQNVQHMELDGENRYLYMAVVKLILPFATIIQRVRLDDMFVVEVLHSSTTTLFTFTTTTSKIYWSKSVDGENVIQEADLDGLNPVTVISHHPYDIIEVYENYIFGYTWGEHSIDRIEIDSGEVTQWIDFLPTFDMGDIFMGEMFIKPGAQCTLSCLNEGDCVLNEDDSEFCKCKKGYTGPTCKRKTVYCCPELIPQD